jgi:single-stranded DNA-binding protein
MGAKAIENPTSRCSATTTRARARLHQTSPGGHVVIDALIAGRIYGIPTERTSRNGNAFATAKVRTPMANGEVAFVNVIAFADIAKAALLALADGDSIAISGELKVSTYVDKAGDAKPSLDLVAHAVLTEYHVQRRRKAMAEAEE